MNPPIHATDSGVTLERPSDPRRVNATKRHTENTQRRGSLHGAGGRLGVASKPEVTPAKHASDKGEYLPGVAWGRFITELTHMRKGLLGHWSQYVSTTYRRKRHHPTPATPRSGVSRKVLA